MRLLLAEDDPVLANRLRTLLEEAGYVVVHSSEGVDAEYQGQVYSC
jgi:two-component system, OmpR family, response regulator